MSSYTPKQYEEQRRITARIVRCNAQGVCPVCGEPQGAWPNGQRRMTCGRTGCYERWLRVGGRKAEHKGEMVLPGPQGVMVVTFAKGSDDDTESNAGEFTGRVDPDDERDDGDPVRAEVGLQPGW